MSESTWLIKRNCSASPGQLALVFGLLVAVSFAFGAGFAAHGLWMVLPFVGLELVAVATAFHLLWPPRWGIRTAEGSTEPRTVNDEQAHL